MKRFVLIVLLVLLWPGVALAQDANPLVVPAGQHLSGSVATVSRDIRVEGTVDGDVTSWSGSIVVVGQVGGDVVSYGGNVTIAPGGQVAGNILASGGALQIEAGGQVAGQRIESGAGGGALASLLDLVVPGTGSTELGSIGRVLFGATAGVLLAAFCLLFVAFWPRRTQLAATTLVYSPGRSLAVGGLTTVLLALVLPPFLALLIASVVGVPVGVVLLVLVLAAYAYGLAVVARVFSRWLADRTGTALGMGVTPVLALLALVLPCALVAMVAPLVGAALFHVVALPGLGAAILSRGGTLPQPIASA